MLKNLFNNGIFTRFYDEQYVPHVRHIFYPLLMMAVGWKCLYFYDWMIFGTWVFAFGCGLMFVILVGIAWRGPIEYWDKISEAVKAMLSAGATPLEVKKALGFYVPEPTVIEYTEHGKNTLPTITYKNLPLPKEVLHTVANKVLLSKSTDFTETQYANIIPNFRKEKDKLLRDGYIIKSSNAKKAKHVLTRKGINLMYEYADNAIKLQIEKESKNAESYQE